MQLIGINAYDWAIFLVQSGYLKSVLPIFDYIIVEFIPQVEVSACMDFRARESIYQNDTAASLGPGNAAMGLKYKRWATKTSRYQIHATSPRIKACQTKLL